MRKRNKWIKPKHKMVYSDKGQPLGYVWQTHKDFDPFADWRERWSRKPMQGPMKPVVYKPRDISEDMGYGSDRYQGD